jgi:hypothetical protein
MELPSVTTADIKNRFAYHPANTEEKKQAHGDIRAAHGALAEYIRVNVPNSREKSIALTKLEESMFWANAAIARNG